MVMGRLQAAPELYPARRGVRRQVFFGHPKRVDLNADGGLIVPERSLGQQVDLFHVVVGHGEASIRGAAAVNHDVAAGSAQGAIKLVRVAQVERQVEVRVRMQPVGHDRVETLGRLEVAFETLGSEHAGHVADWISAVKLESVSALEIKIQFAALLEYADMHRVSDPQALAIQPIEKPVALVDPGQLGGLAGRKARTLGRRVRRHRSCILSRFRGRGKDPFTVAVGAESKGIQGKGNSDWKGGSTHLQESAKLWSFVQSANGTDLVRWKKGMEKRKTPK